MTDETKLAKVEPMPLNVIDAPKQTPKQTTAIDYPAMLKLAIISKDVDVDKLERVAALVHRQEDRNARAEFNAAFAKFKSECPEIYKNKTANIATTKGGSYSYTFADLPKIVELVDPVLEANGFLYAWDGKNEKDWVEATFILTHESGHSESSNFGCAPDMRSGASTTQAYSAARTVARRQSLVARLGLVACDEDTDGAIPEAAQPKQDQKPKTITTEQANDLNDRFIELGEYANLSKFLEGMEVEKLSDIPAIRLEFANQQLDKKTRLKRAAESGAQNSDWVDK